MAEASAPVNSAVPANPGATTTGESALPKSPFADTQTNKPSEPTTSGATATANGGVAAPSIASGASTAPIGSGTGVNGSGTKQTDTVPDPAAGEPSSSLAGNTTGAPSSSSTSAQPPIMTGALPLGDQSKPAESTEKDGVEDVNGASATPKPTAPAQDDGIEDASAGSTTAPDAPPSAADTSISDSKPSALNGAEKKDDGTDSAVPVTTSATGATSIAPTVSKVPGESKDTETKDVEMKDAAPPVPSTSDTPASEKPYAPAPVTAPVPDISGVAGATGAPTTTPALATPATAAAKVSGGKRKANADADGSPGEPAAKKQKGAFSKAVDKAKQVVGDVKEKAKPGRKPGKKAKKETAPVGRTERKTRSQARTE